MASFKNVKHKKMFVEPRWKISYIVNDPEKGSLLDVLNRWCGMSDHHDETAIVIEDPGELMGNRYHILVGDHRKEYSGLSLDECMKYFERNIHLSLDPPSSKVQN